jgi:hypothetical protein
MYKYLLYLLCFILKVREMANQGAKKRKEENIRHMARIRRIIIACNVLFLYTITLISISIHFKMLVRIYHFNSLGLNS